MDFKSSPLGGLYASLRQVTTLKPGQSLDECELRADSQATKDLRVKTGKRSGWSLDTRKAHQTNASFIVREHFYHSVNALIAQRTGLTHSQKTDVNRAASGAWQEVANTEEYLTPGKLKTLYQRAVTVVDTNAPRPSQPAVAVAASSSSSTSAAPHTASVVMHSRPREAKSAHVPPVPQLVHVHTSPSSVPGGTRAAALTALQQKYPASAFPSAHGNNDAASPQVRQSAFHQRLELLVDIAATHTLRAIAPTAAAGGFKTLVAAASVMKVNPGMHPAAALYQQLLGSEADKIYKAYGHQVDDHFSLLTQMSPQEKAEMRKQLGKSN
jgi:hypothetical protein